MCEMVLVADHRCVAGMQRTVLLLNVWCRFYVSTGQSQESTTAATMIEWLDFVNNIFKSTNFEGGIGLGIQVKVAAVRANFSYP